MLELIKLLLVGLLAVVCGAGIGRQGVVSGFIGSGICDVRICGRRLVGQFVQFRPNKCFFKLALVPA